MATSTENLAAGLALHFPPLRDALKGCTTQEAITALVAIEQRINYYSERWQQHPQCKHWQTLPSLDWMKQDEPGNAQVVIAYKHAPGVGGREYSFALCSVGDLTAAYHWSTRTRIGDFAGVYPLPEWMDADPMEITLNSSTHEGRARGFHCRQELKRLLPARLQKWVSKTRGAKKRSKITYLSTFLWEVWKLPLPVPDMAELKRMERAKGFPEAYYTMSKADMWVMEMKHRYEQDARGISYYIRLKDFYMVATGQVEPLTVESLFIRTPNRLSSKLQVQLPLL